MFACSLSLPLPGQEQTRSSLFVVLDESAAKCCSHMTYQYTGILLNYRNTREKYRNTCERHQLKKAIQALIKKCIYSEDDLEKPRGQRSSYEQRILIRRLIWVFTGRTGLIVLKVFSKFSWFLFPQISFIPLLYPRHTKFVGVYSFRFSVRPLVRSFVRSSFRHRVKVFALKFIRPHILKTLWWISFTFGMMVDIGLKFLSAPSPPQGWLGVKVTDFEFS